MGHRRADLPARLRADARASATLLAPQATLVPAPVERPPCLLKTVAPLRHPAEVMVLIDADMIVTRSLAELIDEAAAGRVVAFENDSDRFVPEWGELLDLGPVRAPALCLRQPRACVGRGRGRAEAVLRAARRPPGRGSTSSAPSGGDTPIRTTRSSIPSRTCSTRSSPPGSSPSRIVALDRRLAAAAAVRGPARRSTSDALRCAYADGVEPYVLHHFAAQALARADLPRRLLAAAAPAADLGDDLAIRVPREQVPLRLRGGLRACAERKRVNAATGALVRSPSGSAARSRGRRRGGGAVSAPPSTASPTSATSSARSG